MDYNFPKSRRLLTQSDYQPVFKKAAIKVRKGSLLLLAAQNATTQPKLGLVVAKRYVKHAVNRNQIKRWSREIFRHQAGKLGNMSVVLLLKQKVTKATLKDIKCELQQAFLTLQKRIDKI